MLPILLLVLSFAQVGFFGIGGDASAQCLMEHEVLTLHRWLSPEQLADLTTMCRALPGGNIVNAAALTGALTTGARIGFWGSVGGGAVCVLALCAPSVVWTYLLERITQTAQGKSITDCVLTLLRPLVPGLVVAAAMLMMNAGNFGSTDVSPWQFWISLLLFTATLVGNLVFRINTTVLVVLCGIAGMILL